MIDIQADYFAYGIRDLGVLASMTRQMLAGAQPTTIDFERYAKVCGELNKIATSLGLVSSAARCQRFKEFLLSGNSLNAQRIAQDAEDVCLSFQDELKDRRFLCVPSDRAAFYKGTVSKIFGETVALQFPSAIDDLEEAMRCYAFGRPTATVFHLMRVGELLAESLAKSIGVTVPPNPKPNQTGWGYFAKETGTRITEWSANRNIAPADWDSKKDFYQEAHADLLALNKAWRNSTMHMDKTYTVERARQIMDATKAFIGHIAAHVDEQGNYTP